ncbi:MAG: glucose-6-phosphate dehydrogenase assembly protein OpcA [Acidobacteria bacterium]|nr:glucose-6-phosphate dehydrogenase assembly protein OpcA [Acidobacteriota bacterium]MCW5967095.1 glucose-6-phosphate dehydrogenase assembly protein OpcA [Blastocatellales bacterium]
MGAEPAPHPGLNVVALERELNALWTNLGEEDPHSGVTRTCVLNLIIYADADSIDHHLDETLIEVTEKHAGRVILLTEDHAAESPLLDAWVTSRCTLPTASAKQVCCEQVTIKAATSSIRETPSAIASLLLSDLPVYLWRRGNPDLHSPLFRRLASLSNRVLVDSRLSNNPSGSVSAIAGYFTDGGRVTPLSDLNWTRTVTWRAVLAGFYDVPDYRSALDAVNRVEIKYLAPEAGGLAPRALYLAAWLASRLGWRIDAAAHVDGDSCEIDVWAQGRPLRLTLQAITGVDRPGHLEHITLVSAAGASFSVRKTPDGQRLVAQATLGADRRAERVSGYDQWTESALLDHELEALGRERVFEQTAKLADRILDLLAPASSSG